MPGLHKSWKLSPSRLTLTYHSPPSYLPLCCLAQVKNMSIIIMPPSSTFCLRSNKLGPTHPSVFSFPNFVDISHSLRAIFSCSISSCSYLALFLPTVIFNKISKRAEINICIQSDPCNRKSRGYSNMCAHSWITLCTDFSATACPELGKAQDAADLVKGRHVLPLGCTWPS